MEYIINVTVRDKIAVSDNTVYICGNGDFFVHFDFDDEWKAFDKKTARFIWGRKYQDVVFEGNICPVPVMINTDRCLVGVFAGNLKTTTPAFFPATKSILCGGGIPEPPADDVYTQIMEMLNALNGDIGKAVSEYLKDNPINNGLPAGGKSGQYLQKVSDKDGDVVWADLVVPKEYGLVTYDQDKTIKIT